MAYNFDYTPYRRSPHVHNKWTFYPNGPLPMWVADMDFQSPKPILDELHKVVDQGVLGYETPSKSLLETVAARMDFLYGWEVKHEAVTVVPGTVNGFSVAAREFCTPKKGVMIQTPADWSS